MKYYRLAIVSLLVLCLLPIKSLAQEANGTGGQGLEISPPLLELNANPGENKELELKVRNVTQQALVVKGQVEDFLAAGEDGQPKILLDSNEKSPFSIKDWISGLPSETIDPGKQATFKILLHVPENAAPGGHYGVIRFTGAPPELESSGVTLTASVGSLVLLNVSGEAKEQATIAQLATLQNGKERSLFEYGPVELMVRLQNTGTVHFKPAGTIRVTNIFGKKVADFQFNSNGSNVLPDSTRRFSETLNKKLLFGRYKVQVDLTYGSAHQILSQTKTFWVIPYKLVILSLLAILLLIFAIKGYNKQILKRADKKHSNNADPS